jgi:hypothetical protein
MTEVTYHKLEQIVKVFPYWDCMYVTATTGGTHATNSYHYRGEAIDVGSGGTTRSSAALHRHALTAQAAKDRLAAFLYPLSSFITEEIHTRATGTSGWYVKNGVRVGLLYYGKATAKAHINHVHFAIATLHSCDSLIRSDYFKVQLKAFQHTHGLVVDGILGPKTSAVLNSLPN